MGKTIGWAFVGMLALFASSGCASHNTVEEADRQGIDVARQILLAQDVELDRIEEGAKAPGLEASPIQKLAIQAAVAGMREKNRDAKAINDQLLANFHPPQQPVVYSHAEMQSLLKRMHDAHTATFWAGVGAALLAGASTVIALARSPFAKMIPGIGTILTSMDSTLGAVGTWVDKMKATGKPELIDVADGLQNVLAAAHEDAKVSPYVAKALEKIRLADATPDLVHDVAEYAVAEAVDPSSGTGITTAAAVAAVA